MSLLDSARGMAVGTVASRATGFLRNVALAAVLGVAGVGTVYDVANTTPNIVYELLLGGVLTSVVVPLLVRAAAEDPDGGAAYAQRLLALVVLVLGAATVALVVGAPLLVDLYAGDLAPADRELAVVLARFFLPQLLFYGVGAVLGAVLNTRGRFAPPMWAPVLNNLVVIATLGAFLLLPGVSPLRPETITDGQVVLLGVGTTLGIVVQTVALVPSLRAAGFRLRLRRDVGRLHLGELGRLARWTLLYVLLNQLAYLVVVNLATADPELVDEGRAFASYVKAFTLWQLPHAVVAVSLITALMPDLSRAAAAGRPEQVRAGLDRGLRLTVAVLVPAALAYVVLGREVAVLVFAHGRVTVEQAQFIGAMLALFSVGMVAFSAYQLQLRSFWAQRDTRTPVLVNLWVNASLVAVDLALYALLPDDLKVLGLAAGHATSFVVGLLVCSRVVRRRLGPGDGTVLRTAVRCLLAGLLPALLALAVRTAVVGALGDGPLAALVALLVAGPLLVVGYALLAARLRVPEVVEAAGPLVRRLPGRRRPPA